VRAAQGGHRGTQLAGRFLQVRWLTRGRGRACREGQAQGAPPRHGGKRQADAALNAEATRQAAMVAYLDDFKLMMIIVVLAAPLLLFLRKPQPARAPAAAAAAE
jgi:hypothetical protein